MKWGVGRGKIGMVGLRRKQSVQLGFKGLQMFAKVFVGFVKEFLRVFFSL